MPSVSKEKRIPFGRHSLHFAKIQNCLASVLRDIRNIPGLPAKILWVTCRLNRTDTKIPEGEPVFVGWVEAIEAITIRVSKGFPYAPIDLRFGDTHPSKLYSNCLKTRRGKIFPSNWLRKAASRGSQEIGKNFYGETDRRSAPIKIAGRSVGTLNAAFLGDPKAVDGDIEKIMVRWAQTTGSDLVTYIKNNLEYSPGRLRRKAK